MNKKILLGIGAVLILILIAHFTSKIQPVVDEANNVPFVPRPEQIGSETPVDETNVVGQPTYLIDTYSKNGKDYIDVDYLVWFHGDAAIEPQVEDGICTDASDCEVFPNGHKRNSNPQIRTFEVSADVSVEVAGAVESEINQTMGQPISIPFKQFQDIISKMNSYTDVKPTFKPTKDFVIIDVQNNLVTKINEEYQE